MTQRKHLKQLVRARMTKTGERYATARRHVLGAAPSAPLANARGAAFHLAGNVPAATALRVLVTAAGVLDPRTKQPFSEAMLFGIAGGIGIGVFSFLYEKDNFASFFIGGRHRWHDDQAYLGLAFDRLGVRTKVHESAGAGAAAKWLRDRLADGKPCIVWLESGLLPHRAPTAEMLGGGYYVATVYEVDESAGEALVGDLTDEPITMSLAALADARARIKKFKNRALSVAEVGPTPSVETLVRDGLHACHAGLLGEGAVANARGNFVLEALRVWADRLTAAKGAQAWVHVYAPGRRLWNGLTMLYDFIEHAGTGGGLCRPIFAEFLHEAAVASGDSALASLGDRYAALGRQWSELAHAALPDEVPELREARELSARRAELIATGGPDAIPELQALRKERDALARAFSDRPSLSDAAYATLRTRLREMVLALHEGEVGAHAALGEWLKE